MAKKKAASKTKQVHAVGAAVGRSYQRATEKSRRLQEAMENAVLQALQDGIPMSNADEVKARMTSAREGVLSTMALEDAELASEAAH